MAAIGTTRAQQLTDQATAAGLTAEQIAAHVRVRPQDLAGISGANETRIEQYIREHAHRQQVVDRVVHLAGLDGRDQDTVRANTASFSTSQLEQIAADAERKMRAKGIDTRTAAERKAAAAGRAARAAAPATDGQVSYLVDLLARRTRTGEGGGYTATGSLYTAAGDVDRAAVKRLTREQASQMIDSLKGAY